MNEKRSALSTVTKNLKRGYRSSLYYLLEREFRKRRHCWFWIRSKTL